MVLLIWLFSATPSQALEVKDLSIHYRRFHKSARLLEIPGFQAKEAVNLRMNVDVLGPVYWNNTIRSLTDGGGYKYVSWNLFLGVRVFDRFHLEYEHMSGHLLDHSESAYQSGRFPVQDSLGFVWRLFP